ncbi:MAG: 4Fe-4S binding protein, partial [Clostridia bacterium]|nr:4Fe-4S binding protein [Clostridia bacterium]
PYYVEKTVSEDDYKDRERISRAKMPQRSADERKHDFNEINLGFSEETAKSEAKRCLECGCHDFHECKLIKYANQYDVNPDKYKGDKHNCEKERKLVSIERDQNKCVLCNLCVRVCDEEAKKGIIGLVGRGFTTVIKPEFDTPDAAAFCKDCLKCVNACPTGALKAL